MKPFKPKLWEEMTDEEKAALENQWAEKVKVYLQRLKDEFFNSQDTLRLLRDREGIHCVTLDEKALPEKCSATLPDETGFFLWYRVDLSYADVGLVQVLKDPPKHLARLQEQHDKGSRNFLVYKNSKGETLTMYHQAHDHLPSWNKDGVPWVDGYISFDFGSLK